MTDKLYQYFSTVQFKNVVKEANKRAREQSISIPKLNFRGTIKLHGSNCSVYSELNNIRLVKQSKNNVITQEKDSYSFALFVDNHEKVFTELFEKIKTHYSNQKLAVIYGEWCGQKIQQLSSFANLDYMYFIFAIKLIDKNEKEYWLNEKEIKTLLDKDKLINNQIYCVFDFKTYDLEIDMSYPQLSQNDLVLITQEVEKCCPVAKTFGVNGVGEGVVWRCTNEGFNDLVFKVKGQEHSVTNVTTLASVDTEKVNSTYEFIEKVVTENRLKQGPDYLKEQHLDVNRQNISVFLSWMAKDCIKEEKDIIVESNLNEKDVMRMIALKSKDWYLKQMDNYAKPKML
jgi:hypothetical protein